MVALKFIDIILTKSNILHFILHVILKVEYVYMVARATHKDGQNEAHGSILNMLYFLKIFSKYTT